MLIEIFVVNYRPVLINGCLEASYPSSTTTLVICVMSSALIQFNLRLKNSVLKKSVVFIIIAFVVFMVLGRLISGVHWVTDIIGGALISASLVQMYKGVVSGYTKIEDKFVEQYLTRDGETVEEAKKRLKNK